MRLPLALVWTCLTAVPAAADAPAATVEPATEVHALRFSPAADLAATGALFAGWLSTETFLKKRLAPAACSWCNPNPVDAWGRGLRGAPGQLQGYDMASNVMTFGVVSVAALGTEYWLVRSSQAPEELALVDAVIVLEAVWTALAVNQVVKFAVGRERPFVHDLPESEKALLHNATDNNLSFFSGHSTFAFSIVAATATVARLRGYKRAWLAWAIGLPLALSAPLLRMASDRHYFTDVLTGSVFGAAVGVAVPTLFHGRADEASSMNQLRLVPAPGGLALAGVF